VSVLNAALGDYLHSRSNGLAIEAACYHRGTRLNLTPNALRAAHPAITPRLCVLVHGLGCHEGIWEFPPDPGDEEPSSYGALLHLELGYTPFAVRYNTGLAVAESGCRLAGLLAELTAAYPGAIEEIVLIGHSMGGLVARQAALTAARDGAAWAARLTRVFYLGTPHDGADLARLGHTAAAVLEAVPNPVTRLIGTVINTRSEGIKDLRLGAGSCATDAWPAHVQQYVIAGALGGDPEHPVSWLMGDGLVRLPGDMARYGVPAAHVRLLPATHHMRLTRDPEVYRLVKDWCAGTNAERRTLNAER
jgi:pimeloyl-ACP methyl ester carboxylesterase